jgi:FAD/FMN-containing dehydrogenase
MSATGHREERRAEGRERAALLERLAALLGPRGLITDPGDMARYAEDWRKLYRGAPLAVLRPDSAETLAAAVRLLGEAGVGIVPQGGNTGMVGGAAPHEGEREVVVSLERLNRLRERDPVDLTLTVEAGMTLKAAQEAAAEIDAFLPLSIASEGSATIGGVLSTNAGGNLTVRFGNARELALGLEVVLPSGEIWHGLRRLRKDNTGYALRHLFIGAEGTLGIITAAVLRLVPAFKSRAVGFVSLPSAEAALALFGRIQRFDPTLLLAYEYMARHGLELVLAHIPGTEMPIPLGEHHALIELASTRPDVRLEDLLGDLLGAALEAGEVLEATLATSQAQAARLWRLREEHAEAQRLAGVAIRNDVSVPVSAVPAFLEEAAAACRALIPGIRVVAFGHMGDGNIHFNLRPPEGMAPAAFLAHDREVMEAVNAVVRRLGGSFSAEHGVGRLKTYLMESWRGGAELAAMRAIKAALDPRGIMNPGKVLP